MSAKLFDRITEGCKEAGVVGMNQIDLRPMPQSYQALLDRATKLFEADQRVRAMWLHGAIARGAHDAASDLDIDIAVRDQDFDAFTAESEAWWANITPAARHARYKTCAGHLLLCSESADCYLVHARLFPQYPS